MFYIETSIKCGSNRKQTRKYTQHTFYNDYYSVDCYLKNSQSDKVNQLSYLVDLHTLHPGESEIKIVSMACSLEQLQDLVGKLKDAVRCVEKQVSS
ncbi:COMMD3 [Bugula neritina]|uniref:COMM domain-containing protein 3 n=1 Tax=Bugula neritina TaxID=10212 RepID=A0A7J7J028_BUGNE|nr:COMMD3 [Bugula neritina]